jgi:hypothetical protein
LKQFANDLLAKENDAVKKSQLSIILQECNEALYSPIAMIDRDTIIDKMKNILV